MKRLGKADAHSNLTLNHAVGNARAARDRREARLIYHAPRVPPVAPILFKLSVGRRFQAVLVFRLIENLADLAPEIDHGARIQR